ncbi:heavy-metal-associated domain-containing protein [Winogradskyella jejuensis]|uniref:Cu+-exporting ATPase n=1 Tax=Winogradskyella jejuensis TaxID=1089305 RepID=A0A1M5NE69_9FLAO|nr:heavy metal-associated domain-containing protein [Winogradskyella jejuensis]SHG87808.1 Cu+-exporting ATPase [Winogradskyella jejuensis]
MKIFKNIITVVALALVVIACKNNSEPEVKTVEIAKKETKQALDPNATYAKVEFNIEGMTCAVGCAKTIEKKMAKMEGVKMAKVDFDKKLAMVEYDEAKVSPNSLKEAVGKVSDIYEVKDIKNVDAFSSEKKECKADCKMDCCKDKSKEEKEKMACAKDCKKACCKAEKA